MVHDKEVAAAGKIQALHRGKSGRRRVEGIRLDKRKEQSARRIQSLQRGKQGRRHAAQRKQLAADKLEAESALKDMEAKFGSDRAENHAICPRPFSKKHTCLGLSTLNRVRANKTQCTSPC